MARMREPFTGGVFDVPAHKVAKYIGRGYALLDGEPAPVDEHPDERPADPPVAKADEPKPTADSTIAEIRAWAKADEPKPTADSTIAEIRAWAKANGVPLPKSGNKAEMLAAIG